MTVIWDIFSAEERQGLICENFKLNITAGFREAILQKIPFFYEIKLLESPIPTAPTAATSSQKAHFDNISGTKRGTIDPLVSKRPEKNSE